MRAADEAGFTQTSLERAARFSGGYLTRLLYREQDRIEMSKLERLCDLLGCRMHWLATGREPMREGEPRAPVEEAMVTARRYGVTEDVFWFVRGRDANQDARSEADWFQAFLDENRKRVEDEHYAKAAKRVAMDEAKRNPPPSTARKRRMKVA